MHTKRLFTVISLLVASYAGANMPDDDFDTLIDGAYLIEKRPQFPSYFGYDYPHDAETIHFGHRGHDAVHVVRGSYTHFTFVHSVKIQYRSLSDGSVTNAKLFLDDEYCLHSRGLINHLDANGRKRPIPFNTGEETWIGLIVDVFCGRHGKPEETFQ